MVIPCSASFLEAAWALNTLDVIEASTTLCGTEAGADMRDGLRINGIHHNRQYTENVNMEAGGAAFYEGAGNGKPEEIECKVFYDAVEFGKELCVKPEQAATVTRILEAIYTSAQTGKPVIFED